MHDQDMESSSLWLTTGRLLDAGKYEEARAAATWLLEHDRETLQKRAALDLPLRERGLANLLVRRYADALADFEQARLVCPVNAHSDHLWVGIGFWTLGNTEQALAVWQRGTASAVGVPSGVEAASILLYGAVRVAHSGWQRYALAILRGFAVRGAYPWPAPAAAFLLGRIDAARLELAALDHEHPPRRQAQVCQAQFYQALAGLRSGDIPTFQQFMELCAAHEKMHWLMEFHLARWEVSDGFSSLVHGR